MGLREVIRNAVEVAFKATGDVPLLFTYRHYGAGMTRDMDTGSYDRSWVDTPDVQVIKGDTKLLEGRANVTEATDVFLIKGSQVPVITIGDYLYGNGTYEVLDDIPDPTESLHQVAVRTSKVKIDATDNIQTIDGGGASGEPTDTITGGGA